MTANSAHTVAKSATCRVRMPRKSPRNASTIFLSSLDSLRCMPIQGRLKKCGIEALGMNMSQERSVTFLMRTFTGIYSVKRLLLMTRQPHMSTSLALVTLLSVFPLMVLHHSNIVEAQPGLLSFSTTISPQKYNSKRVISLVWVLSLAIKSL